MTEQNVIETTREEEFYPIPYESLFEIDFPEELPVYDGEGATSYDKDYDGDKVVFMDKLGVEIPDTWQEDRAFIVSGFITLQYILAWERARRDGLSTEKFYHFITNKLNNHRLEQGNASSNPTRQLTEEELAAVGNYIVNSLKETN